MVIKMSSRDLNSFADWTLGNLQNQFFNLVQPSQMATVWLSDIFDMCQGSGKTSSQHTSCQLEASA